MSLTIKPMIVTSDGQTFETEADARQHELETLIKSAFKAEGKQDAEQVAAFIIDCWAKIELLLTEKPKKGGSKKRRAPKTKAAHASETPPHEPDPVKVRATKQHSKAAITAGEVPDNEISPGTRIEPSEKWKDR